MTPEDQVTRAHMIAMTLSDGYDLGDVDKFMVDLLMALAADDLILLPTIGTIPVDAVALADLGQVKDLTKESFNELGLDTSWLE